MVFIAQHYFVSFRSNPTSFQGDQTHLIPVLQAQHVEIVEIGETRPSSIGHDDV